MPLISRNTTSTVGKATEAFAAQYLVENGLQLITTNFHNRGGEIDLIMQDQDALVFVEVKYRKNDSFGGPLSAISVSKQKKIKQCAAFYMQQAQLKEYNTLCRFDVVALQGDINQPHITWLKNAF